MTDSHILVMLCCNLILRVRRSLQRTCRVLYSVQVDWLRTQRMDGDTLVNKIEESSAFTLDDVTSD